MKKIIMVLLLTVLSAFTVQAAILVDFGARSNWVTASANGQGLITNTWKYVPFSMASPRSPTNGASGYAGPGYYGGATGTVSMASWNIANATPDYINGSGTSTGIGSKVTVLIMFTNQSATITQVVYGLRVSGTSTAQTNFARIVIRKTDGSFYISEAKSSQSMAYFTNSNPGALTWYSYNPGTAFLTIGSQAAGLTLNNVDAIGEFLENRVTATNQTSANAGIQVFQSWGITVQDQTITFPNPGNQIITNSVVLNATASSGLSVTYGVVSGPASLNGSTVTFTGTGSVTLSANQVGNGSWNPAPQTNVTFTVNKATASVSLSGLSQTYNGLEHAVTASTVPSGLTVGVTYNGGSTLPISNGNYSVVATVSDSIYQGSASNTLVISLSNLNVRAYAATIQDVWTNGTVRSVSSETRIGRQATNILSSGVMAFELPDMNGAAVISACLKFRVNSKVGAMNSNYNANINIEAIRSAPFGSTIMSNDYRGLGLYAGEISIQNDVAVWTNSVPRDYEATGAATNTLGAWLADQYDSVGIGGLAFLRLAPDQDPVQNYYFSLSASSIELVITTDGNVDPIRGFGNTVSTRIGVNEFRWTFDQNVNWGHFMDGMPWVVLPAGGNLALVSVSPARLNNQAVHVYPSNLTNADINITVKNPPFDHTFDTNTQKYVDNTNGVCGWDSRFGAYIAGSPKYNPSLGWDGSTWLALSAGDSITTAKSTVQNPMPDRCTPLDALAVLTVLTNIPPDDAFRPGVIRAGADRTSPEILRYSNLINLSPYLISNPVGLTTDLRGTNVTSLDAEYTFTKIRACLPGPGFLNTGYSRSEGASARFNNYIYPVASVSGQYGGTLGGYMGKLAVGSLASWLTPEERKVCHIRYIQRAIDAYSAVKSGLCLEEGCGILPGYSTLITTAGVMLNHADMKSVNNGVNGVKPWFIFADYATCFHTDGVSSNDLAVGESQGDRLIALYNTTTNRPELNKTNVNIAAASANTITMKTNFYWGACRAMVNIINLKVRVISGTGAGSTIYVITNAITTGVTDTERFRTASGMLYTNGVSPDGYGYGGKIGVRPAWQNGIPDTNSKLAFSITTSDLDNTQSDDAAWYWGAEGIRPDRTPVSLEKVISSVCVAPLAELYASIHTGATIDNLIALYALGQQSLYKGGLDKYMINAGTRPGYGEVLFNGGYLAALSGATGNMRGALWKQEVLDAVGATFQYTDGTTGALDIPHTHAKMWYEP